MLDLYQSGVNDPGYHGRDNVIGARSGGEL